MTYDVESGWEVDQAIEPMNTKLARLSAEQKLEESAKGTCFAVFHDDVLAHDASSGLGTLTSSGYKSAFIAAIKGAEGVAEPVWVDPASGDITLLVLHTEEPKTIAQVRAMLLEAYPDTQYGTIEIVHPVPTI